MALASLALKRLFSSNISKFLCPGSSRFYNTFDFDDDTRVFSEYPEAFDPYPLTSTSSPSLMDQFMDTSSVSGRLTRNWDAKETSDGLKLRVVMPGLGKEDVKVSIEQNTLIIKGNGKTVFEDGESGRSYSSRINLPDRPFKTTEIKAEMKNGVLKVFLPKIKGEEMSDVFHVNID